LAISYCGAIVGNVLDQWLPHSWQWLGWILWPIFALLVVAVLFFAFALLANLLGAPFNGLLAQAVHELLASPADTIKQQGSLK
jgi:CysZ protein